MALWSLIRAVVFKEIRVRWMGLLLLGVIATAWSTVTLSAVAGARRTASVVDRFQRSTLASDATYVAPGDPSGAHLYEALTARPEVASADMLWSATTDVALDDGLFVNLLGGVHGRWGREFDLPVVVRGRAANPASTEEVLVTQGTAELLDVDIGDRLQLPTWSAATWDAWLETRGGYPAFDGPLIDVAIVGVAEMATSLGASTEESLFVVVTPTFLERWASEIGENGVTVVVDFHDPATEPASLVGPLAQILGQPVDFESAEDAYAGALRDSTRASTIGLAVLACAVALAGALVVARGVAREVRASARTYEPLRALGATPSHRIVVLSAPMAIVGAGVAATSAALAGWSSSLFPIGPGRAAEPNPGVWLDLPVLATACAFAVVVLLAAAFATVRPERSWVHRPSTVTRPTAFVRSLGPAVLVGHINALDTRQSRVTILITALTVAGVTATAWYTQGLSVLGSEATRWGYTWSSSPELNFSADVIDERLRGLADHESVESVGFLDNAVAVVDGTTVRVSSFEVFSGVTTAPVVLDGRIPKGTHELALGERTAHLLGVDVGDRVSVDSGFAPPVEWSVVGLVVPPYFGASSDTGTGAYTTAYNFNLLDIPFENRVRVMVVEYHSGASWADVEADLTNDLEYLFVYRSHARTPRAITDLVDVSVVTKALALFFLLLASANLLLAAARRGTRQTNDLLILRTLGFTRRDTTRSLAAEAVTVVLLGGVAGIALGLVVASRVWRLTVGGLGVADAQPSPLAIVGIVSGLALVGVVVSVVVGRVAVGRAQSPRLRHE